MGGKGSRPEAAGGDLAATVLPHDLWDRVGKARARLERDEGVIPCEFTGEFHDNSSGHLRGFSSTAAKRDWLQDRIGKLSGIDVLSSWQRVDADFVMDHAALSGAPMPPEAKLREAVLAGMAQSEAAYQATADSLPPAAHKALLDLDELWPPGSPLDVKNRCVQPEWAQTMRLQYKVGFSRLEQLYLFSVGLARSAGVDSTQVQWSVKLPMRMQSKASALHSDEYSLNNFRHSSDVFRTGIVAEDCIQIHKMVTILECMGRETFDRATPLKKLGLGKTDEYFVVERIKNRFARPPLGGYRDILVNLRISGYVCEIQIHLRSLLELQGDCGRDLCKWFKHFAKDGEAYALLNQPEEDPQSGEVSPATGGRYSGESAAGKRNGKGTFYYDSGDRYEGQWKDGARHGRGSYYYVTGDQYTGDWRDDQMHGAGNFVSHGGDRYEGAYLNGLRHGEGIFTSAAGEVTRGAWWKNKPCEIARL